MGEGLKEVLVPEQPSYTQVEARLGRAFLDLRSNLYCLYLIKNIYSMVMIMIDARSK